MHVSKNPEKREEWIKNISKNRINTSGSNNGMWKEKVPVVCQYCGKIIYLTEYKAKKRKYCSLECKYAAGMSNEARKNMREKHADFSGENHPGWQERVKCVCQRCGKIKYLLPRVANITKYCSIECFYISLIGRKRSEEHQRKLTENHPDFSGKNNPNWLNGKSFEIYDKKFNNQLREYIRKRDNYRCQQCFRHQDELYSKNGKKYKLCIHHIDYNKKNSEPTNLISLCRNCHNQTNYKREDWINYFKNKI